MKTAIPVLAVFLLLLPASTAEEQADSLMPLVGLWGADSAVTGRAYQRVTDRESWVALWLAHRGVAAGKHSEYYNEAGVPDVDFERCMVVAILQGEAWNSAGVRVDSVTVEGDHLRLRYDDRSYQTAGPDGGGRKARAYGFFVLPRSAKPLVLEENVQGLIGKPPEWKLRARLD
jgi:hypothetical protein